MIDGQYEQHERDWMNTKLDELKEHQGRIVKELEDLEGAKQLGLEQYHRVAGAIEVLEGLSKGEGDTQPPPSV